jgi:predicted SnoaL-like aldol condensation-catalyzing enzyme
VEDIKRTAPDGDLVFVHGRTSWFEQDVVDIYRIENGEIAEHWHVIQPIDHALKNPKPGP